MARIAAGLVWLLWAGAVSAQDAELESALEADRRRIAEKRLLTSEEARRYVRAADLPRKPAKSCTCPVVSIVPVDFADAKFKARDIEERFARLAEFCRVASGGAFELGRREHPVVRLGMSRAEFARIVTGAEEEKAALGAVVPPDAGAVVFVTAGGLGARGTALWPHQDALKASSRTIRYVIVPERTDRHDDGILAHEFGHLLGLEDKYEEEAKVERWCLMGMGYLGDRQDKAMPLCVVCRERLGWTVVGEIDPASMGKVSLGPGESARMPMGKDGAEALILEMRGSDTLLAWHVGGGKSIELAARFPSERTDRLTPYSDPPFLGRTLGSRGIWLTDVRVEGGRAFVRVGQDGERTPLEDLRRSRVGRRLGSD
ncbi:MAG: hypothetical protein HYY16_12875 [Planctomycetes bacterium]|nr:hypothetical protein [Planctomycetota bacterium]